MLSLTLFTILSLHWQYCHYTDNIVTTLTILSLHWQYCHYTDNIFTTLTKTNPKNLRFKFFKNQLHTTRYVIWGEEGGICPLPWIWKMVIFCVFAYKFLIFLHFAPPVPRKLVKIFPLLEKTEMTSLHTTLNKVDPFSLAQTACMVRSFPQKSVQLSLNHSISSYFLLKKHEIDKSRKPIFRCCNISFPRYSEGQYYHYQVPVV